ncbi:actinia tenebrosa protease inhibitors-like [Rhipicephalus microplus]|uniref:actinia tenebrosa protease inhibitors-like n=1 Tax=Rhipicephalus microplus TaxID=6941 RepID=UPI003F6C4D6A
MQSRPTRYCQPLKSSWYYKGGICRKTNPTLCGGGANIFPSLQECHNGCRTRNRGKRPRCSKPPVFGRCDPVLQTWRYDSGSGHCKRLNYTICGLGIKEIATEEACYTACYERKRHKFTCSLNPVPTLCNIFHKNGWFFDPGQNACLRFAEGKCASNRNGFPTKERCLERCSYETL